jgi:hypothetical protein
MGRRERALYHQPKFSNLPHKNDRFLPATAKKRMGNYPVVAGNPMLRRYEQRDSLNRRVKYLIL